MKNSVMKFLVYDKQIRIYILNGVQILKETNNCNTVMTYRNDLRKALNVTALMTSLNNDKQRISLRFTALDNINVISTEGFSSKTITGYSNIKNRTDFKKGSLQVIRSTENTYGNSYTSFTVLETGDFYTDISSFYTLSEQVRTKLIPINSSDKNNMIILVQALPFLDNPTFEKTIEILSSLEYQLDFSSIESSKNELIKLFPNVKFLEVVDIPYSCSCSKEMFIGLVFSLGVDEIDSIIVSNKVITTQCSMCGKEYSYTADELKDYFQR